MYIQYTVNIKYFLEFLIMGSAIYVELLYTVIILVVRKAQTPSLSSSYFFLQQHTLAVVVCRVIYYNNYTWNDVLYESICTPHMNLMYKHTTTTPPLTVVDLSINKIQYYMQKFHSEIVWYIISIYERRIKCIIKTTTKRKCLLV